MSLSAVGISWCVSCQHSVTKWAAQGIPEDWVSSPYLCLLLFSPVPQGDPGLLHPLWNFNFLWAAFYFPIENKDADIAVFFYLKIIKCGLCHWKEIKHENSQTPCVQCAQSLWVVQEKAGEQSVADIWQRYIFHGLGCSYLLYPWSSEEEMDLNHDAMWVICNILSMDETT